jgi:hypothetical protein
VEHSYREARLRLEESGYGANEAQDILDDLAHWYGWEPGKEKSFGYRADGHICYLTYMGVVSGQPRFKSEQGRGTG